MTNALERAGIPWKIYRHAMQSKHRIYKVIEWLEWVTFVNFWTAGNHLLLVWVKTQDQNNAFSFYSVDKK